MAKHRHTDKAGFGGNHSTWWLIQALIDAGCTVAASGSGTGGTYSAAGDVFDPAANPYNYGSAAGLAKLASGAGTEPWCSAVRAWILLTLLDGSQLIIQRGTTTNDSGDAHWNIGWAPNGDWTIAGCNTNTCPSATASGKLRWLRGAANGAGSTAFSAGTISTRSHAMADDTASAAGQYSWIVVEIEPANQLGGVLACDAFNQAKSDLMQGAGKVPLVFWTTANAVAMAGSYSSYMSMQPAIAAAAGDFPQALVDFGGGSESWDTVTYHDVGDAVGVMYPANAGAPAAGQPDEPIQIGSRLHGGFFGFSDLFAWVATARSYPDQDTSQYGIYMTNVFVMELVGDAVAGGAAVSAVP